MGILTEFLWSMMVFLLAVRIMRIVVKLITSKRRIQEKIIEEKSIEKTSQAKTVEAPVIEMVQDRICGADVPKHKAYQVVRDNVTHYFCSWDCRQEFISNTKNEREA